MIHRAPTGPIGYRLANELEGLLLGISADGVVTARELGRLKSWRTANASYAHIKPFSALCERVDAILSRGAMTQDDCSDLLFVTGKLTSPNPHFDSMRAGIQVLMGLLAGISSDGVVSPTEAEHLQRWLEAWSHLKGLWPYDECEAIVTASLSGGHDVDSLEYLVGLSEQFPVAGSTEAHGDHLPAVIAGVCAVDPTITFPNRTFVVTGESARCQRAEMEAQIQIRHGLAAPRVTRATDYLIVCDGGNPHWAFACYGRKVEQAYTLRRAGQEIVIVHEIDFWDALAL